MKARRRLAQNPPGLYTHTNPPRVVAPTPSEVRQWLRSGDVDKLESVVIQGQGHKLLGEYASDLKVRSFLKSIPAYLARIDMVHEAADKGSLQDLKALLKDVTDQTFTKKRLTALAQSKDRAGAGLLHKAVYNDNRLMVKWLVDNFPNTARVRDMEGRTPLHYCGRSGDPEYMWATVQQAGADSTIQDSRGHSPAYYMDHPLEADLPVTTNTLPGGRFTSAGQGLVVKQSNIRIWIHDRDIGRLQQVVWEGHGDKLLTQTSQHPTVKQFLSAVPYIMGVIKDVHAAAVNNDIIMLKKRTSPPVPKEILLAKDINGLTPLHKAAGLGHEEVVRTILSICPEAVSRTDIDSRTALHYAAAARGSGATYDTLLDYKANEAVVDKMNHTPSYYIQNPKEVDLRALPLIPEAPRTASVFPPSWDWSYLPGARNAKDRPLPPIPSNNGDSAFEDMAQEDTPEERHPEDVINEPLRVATGTKEETPRPQTYDVDGEADEGVEDEEEENGYNADNEEPEQEGHYEAEYAEVDTEYYLSNQPTNQAGEEQIDQNEAVQNVREVNMGQESRGTPKRIDEFNTDEPMVYDEKEENVRRIVEAGDVDEMAGLVLAGEGASLAEQKSSDPDIQMFINNVPTYLNKIERVHQATRESNLKELQSALDRRKFAVAHESRSPLRLTPLHIAVLYGGTSVLRFLASRFPETMQAVDSAGRTPLHYAATLHDNAHFYNLLARLGADKTVEDHEGKTPEYYREHQDDVTYEHLLEQFQDKQTPDPKSTAANTGLSYGAVTTSGLPLFRPDEGQYLASSLGQPLIAGLTEVANKRPQNPIKYLANYLNAYDDSPTYHPRALGDTYIIKGKEDSQEPISQLKTIPENPLETAETNVKLEAEEMKRDREKIPPIELKPSAFKPVQRDEYGQMMLHFAMARSQGRNALFQLLQEVDCNIAFRDELYRTPRDIAEQVNLSENVESVDKYVVSLAATGQVDKLRELLIEGYDHILDITDDNVNITDVAVSRSQSEVTAFLETIHSFEEKREKLHRAIRLDSVSQVQEILKNNPGLAMAKNTHCRCSLHVAVLNQQDSIVHHIARKYPQTLLLGDNLMRTALHYAMGVDRVEILSNILIQEGAIRVVKDLKGRQPSYYFMNKSEIQKLQEEEEMLRV